MTTKKAVRGIYRIAVKTYYQSKGIELDRDILEQYTADAIENKKNPAVKTKLNR